jgi:hypothetical protein
MYGTILGEENKEEAADLYVYRVAEFKAIQIGHVTRVLKETAVDCIINHGQTEFTQDKINILRIERIIQILKTPIITKTLINDINKDLKEPITQKEINNVKKKLKEPITEKENNEIIKYFTPKLKNFTQILSNGMELNDFKVADAPFSPACDYMAKCDYSCRSDKELDVEKLKNSDTYNENFIMNNSEKILQRIRMLMRESYFYIKENLINAIRTPKEYPRTQIFAALSKLIEDKNEFIVDKYGRNGRLINIGEYYLFQPIELRDENISTFDRSVPIDYKHEMINFEIKENIAKTGKKRDVEEIDSEEKEEMVENIKNTFQHQ